MVCGVKIATYVFRTVMNEPIFGLPCWNSKRFMGNLLVDDFAILHLPTLRFTLKLKNYSQKPQLVKG